MIILIICVFQNYFFVTQYYHLLFTLNWWVAYIAYFDIELWQALCRRCFYRKNAIQKTSVKTDTVRQYLKEQSLLQLMKYNYSSSSDHFIRKWQSWIMFYRLEKLLKNLDKMMWNHFRNPLQRLPVNRIKNVEYVMCSVFNVAHILQ